MISEIYLLVASQMRWFNFYVPLLMDCVRWVRGLLMCPDSGFSVLTFGRLAHQKLLGPKRATRFLMVHFGLKLCSGKCSGLQI